MIKRLYIDNYKCFVNFEYRPAPVQLLFGNNGGGKSTIFEVLTRLREFVVEGKAATKSFSRSLTAWQTRKEQRFELDIEGRGKLYRYVLRIVHAHGSSGIQTIKVGSEELSCDGQRIYWFDGEYAHLDASDGTPARMFPLTASKSGVGFVGEPSSAAAIFGFRNVLESVYVFGIDPIRMESLAEGEHARPDTDLSDFASWYRHLAQESPEVMGALFDDLAQAIDGFVRLTLAAAGSGRRLKAVFRHGDQETSRADEFQLRFASLSLGQRCLIALFTILHCAVRADITLCIDEPDNFIALREMQPWLAQLRDRVEQEHGQCLLISHHPEFIDLLAVKHGALFTREGQGPVRIKSLDWSDSDGLRPSEIIARGWEA